MLTQYHSIYLETTRRCNLSCAYCSTGSNLKGKDFGREMDTDEIIKHILEPAYALGSRFVVFSGGEFLLRSDAFTLLEAAQNIGYRVGMASNGTTLNQQMIDKLKSLLGQNLVISIGVNSFTKKNIETRDVDETFARKTIALLQQNNVNINISVTIGRFNYTTFAETVEEIRAMGLPYNRIPFVPRNTACYELMPDKELLKNYFHPVLSKFFNGFTSFHPLFLSTADYEKHSGHKIGLSKMPTNPSVGCWVGSYFAVTPEGDISPCPLFADHVKGGNIRHTPLKDILFESDVFVKITDRSQLGGKCGSCRYNFTCGGCRVMAYYINGDYMAEDPTCFIDDISAEELARIEKTTGKSFRNYVRMAAKGGLYEENNSKEDNA